MRAKTIVLAQILLMSLAAVHAGVGVHQVPPTEITLGGLFPLSGALVGGGIEREAAARMAVKEINQDDTLLKGVTLKISVRDTATDPNTGATAASELISQGVVGLVGAASSSVSKAVQGVAAQNKIPQISYSSTNPDLSDKSLYPYFLRVVQLEQEVGTSLVDVLLSANITEVATLTSYDSYSFEMMQYFKQSASERGLNIKISEHFEAGAAEIGSQLLSIKDSGTRVIVLSAFGLDVKTVLQEGLRFGMDSPNYLWLGLGGVIYSYEFESSPSIREAMQGMIAGEPLTGDGPVYEHFLDLWESCFGESPDVYAGCGDRTPNTFAPYAYDAVYTFAHALDKMISDGVDVTDGELLLSYLASTDFMGATGRITFNDHFDRNGMYSILKLVGQDFVSWGTWDPVGGLNVSDDLIDPAFSDANNTVVTGTLTTISNVSSTDLNGGTSTSSDILQDSSAVTLPELVPGFTWIMTLPVLLLLRRRKK